jgi:hypothetical protein
MVLSRLKSGERRRSDIAIRAVEAFRRDHGRLPESLAAAGLSPEQFNETCPCYSKSSEQAYVVWFGWRLGRSVMHDSASDKWQY